MIMTVKNSCKGWVRIWKVKAGPAEGPKKGGMLRLATILFATSLLLGVSGAEPKKEAGVIKKSATTKEVEMPAWPVEIAWLNYEEGLKKGKLENKNIFID